MGDQETTPSAPSREWVRNWTVYLAAFWGAALTVTETRPTDSLLAIVFTGVLYLGLCWVVGRIIVALIEGVIGLIYGNRPKPNVWSGDLLWGTLIAFVGGILFAIADRIYRF